MDSSPERAWYTISDISSLSEYRGAAGPATPPAAGTLTRDWVELRGMADHVVPDAVERLAGLIGPQPDAVLERMDAQARAESFPTVGPAVGGWLSTLARLVDARRIFEFGSGFGYSAYWFARALPPDGTVVLTEIDADELDQARSYFHDGGYTDRARFEHGDALDIVDDYDGPFDVVLIDNEKERYVEAFDAVREKLHPGSLVLADNAVTAGTVVDRDEVIELVADGDGATDAAAGSEGIADYLQHVRAQSDLDTVLLPLGEGLAVTVVS
jgi:caffeoyl-CoA O-methyltransferase